MAMSGIQRKTLTLFFIAISAIFIYHSISSSLNQLPSDASNLLENRYVGLALLMAVIALSIAAITHVVVVSRYLDTREHWIEVLVSYCQNQVARYIPGKVLGILSQTIRLSGKVPAAAVWEANITHFLVTNIISIFVIIAVTSYALTDTILPSIMILSVAWFSLYVVNLRYWHIISGAINKLFGKSFKIDTAHPKLLSNRSLTQLYGLLLLDWLFYFFFWVFLLWSDGWVSALYVGAIYALSSIIGMLVFVVPSGFLVREAAFIWFGQLANIPVSELLVIGIISRVLYVMADIIVYGQFEILLGILRLRAKKQPSSK